MSVFAGELPSKQDFSAALDTPFRVRRAEGEDFDLLLVKFDDLISNEVQENFTLLFRAPVDAPREQSIYLLEHETLGEMNLFLVPLRIDDSGLYFEAVFNRFVEPKALEV